MTLDAGFAVGQSTGGRILSIESFPLRHRDVAGGHVVLSLSVL